MNSAQSKESQCLAQPASDGGNASSTGLVSPGHAPVDSKTLFRLINSQSQQIQELNQSVQFLAEQVKTLIDGLAEDADPDEPPTMYMSGRPI